MLKLRTILLSVVVSGGILFLLIFFLPRVFSSTYKISSPSNSLGELVASATTSKIVITHLETPEPLKALYMTSCVASTLSWRESLKKLIETTELNAIVIDIKDYTGVVSFPRPLTTERSDGGRANEKGCVVSDMGEFIQTLHDADIYVIGRISVFQDSSYTKLFPELAVKKKSDGGVWKDYKGLSFIDVGAKPYWDYIVEISKQSYALGFDELNFDYIRYPSDGNMQDTSYTWANASTTKSEMLESFFKYLHNNLKSTGAVLSADLFGMTTTVENDMGIGQVLEKALPYFDYVAPMVYPSHYPKTWNGFANPAEYPYEIIKIAMTSGIEREKVWNISQGFFTLDANGATTTPKSKLRPWLQDFHLGATYDADKVRAQIQATYDVGLTSWMLWNAGNKYTLPALLPE
jgi:hypothetical protein